MNTTLFIVIIHGSKIKDDIMHAADLFENFKAFAMPERCALDNPPEFPLDSILRSIKLGFEERGSRVVAIFAPNHAEGAWRDKAVRMISNGYQWCMLDDALKAHGFVSLT